MKVLAVAGIGAGTALLATLGVWTVSARRRPRLLPRRSPRQPSSAPVFQTWASAQNPTA